MSAPQWKPSDVVTLDATEDWPGLDKGRAAARVAAFLREIEEKWGKPHTHLTANNGGTGTLQWLASAFEAVSKDPKPDEPQGLGAVVEDAEGRRWVRTAYKRPWCVTYDEDGGASNYYPDIAAVRVLSEGWSE